MLQARAGEGWVSGHVINEHVINAHRREGDVINGHRAGVGVGSGDVCVCVVVVYRVHRVHRCIGSV